ncbi:uncharacterized protein LOC108626753 [Ceratina calcarata]|uniref:Uncharacterized protein LOC108626753 n=1 Tax=Ceratina calcarata TaxID=156304 RepID=A0AAJ7J388_9HYME|nr:uncharacterized protein LOC108626753 [Ceratina calcarata]
MPLLRNLSRRFNLLTTDAKPDPPRVPPEGYTHNLEPNANGESKNKSQEDQTILASEQRNSFENDAVPINKSQSSTSTTEDLNDAKSSQNDAKGQKRPNVKTKSKQNCTCRTRTVNYNIINSNDVNIGSKTSYICNVNQLAKNNADTSEEPCSKTKFRQMPMEVECLSVSTDRVTLDDIFVVKTYIGHGWRDVARKLSYSDGQIEQFEENYRFRGISEVIYQIFLDWIQANTKDAEIGKLINILWACKEYDCAERLISARNKSI